jgi:hypothetical protein
MRLSVLAWGTGVDLRLKSRVASEQDNVALHNVAMTAHA